jgi:TPR repeat protein
MNCLISKFSTGLRAVFGGPEQNGALLAMKAIARFGKQKVAILLLGAALSVGLPAVAWAGYDEGLAARQRGDYAAAIKEWSTAAEQGDARAQFSLGAMYRNGEGVAPNATEAANWYRKAASQGHAQAQYSLGVLYQNGTGVTKDDAIAASWYLQAARQGYVQAQYNIAVMYQLGTGVQNDPVEALAWLILANSNGHPGAEATGGRLAQTMKPEQIAAAQRKAEQYDQTIPATPAR